MSAPDSAPSADRNLLFGILALQMDFVSRDALIQAMHTWVLHKSTPLGQILLEQGALRTDTQALLEALVQKHLELHGGDAQKSLASVSSLGSARQQLEQIDDTDLKYNLTFVPATPASEEDPFATQPPAVGEATSAGLRFRILRPHAEGGLGKVFVAHDQELRRSVALKEIKDRFADDPDKRLRFLLEAEITGGLEHPGIVPVYGLGQYADGRPFYAMRFIKGDSLQDAIQRFHQADTPGRDEGERTLALRKLLGRFLDVCNAIAYAHSRGVLHRDLKPGNIMLGKYGETLVVDWGLAKPLGRVEVATETMEGPLQPSSGSGSTPTQMGSALGTPAYMSPEQAAGRLDQLGPASDVYSLGATLYCLLVGKSPFDGTDLGELLRQVQRGEFRPPRLVKPMVPAALEAVCLKAMALKPEDRYASPYGLAEDIEHWLADEPVSAWREPWQIRARRWVGRHRTLVTTAAATLLVATVSLTVATILLQAANYAKEVALQKAKDSAAIVQAVNEFLQKDLLGQADIGQQMVGSCEHRDPDVKVRTLLDRASNAIEGKFKDQPMTQAAIQLTVGSTYRALGQYAEAQRHLEHSVQLRIAKLGAENPDTLLSKLNLANLYSDQSQYGLAEEIFKEVVQAQSAKLGAEHLDTLTSKGDLAELYRKQGKYDLAEPLYKEVLNARTAKLGADHPDTLDCKGNLALLYHTQGKYDLAEPLCREVLKDRMAILGADHPCTLTAKNNLASLYENQGKYDLAEPLYKEVLHARTAKLGADHPDTLTSKNNLALLYQNQGKYDLAEPLYKEVLNARTAKLGADHPDTLTSKNNLASLYYDLKKYDLAEPLYKEALKASIAKLGADHPSTLLPKGNLALLYSDQKKYDLAEPLYKEVLKTKTAKLGADHPDTLITKNNLAMLYYSQGKNDLAEPLHKEVLKAKTAKLGADHPSTLRTKNNLAMLYEDQGKNVLAEALYKEVLKASIAKLGADHPSTLRSKRNLAAMYHDQGKNDLAEPLFKEVLQAQTTKLRADDSNTLVTMAALSLSLLQQKKYAEAEPLLRECLALRVKKQPDAWSTFNTRSMLGEALTGQKKYIEAEPLLQQGYEGMKQREKNIPLRSKDRLAKGLERLVQLYDAWGKKDKADAYRKKLEAERAKSSSKKK